MEISLKYPIYETLQEARFWGVIAAKERQAAGGSGPLGFWSVCNPQVHRMWTASGPVV